MTQQRILLVDANKARAHQLRDAIVRAQLPSPISRDDGESAIMWVGLNDCSLCIISYELPTLDGLR
jgi:DNA-binding response OmpR family regulator